MTNQPTRRDFLRQGINIGAGFACCCINLSCSRKSQQASIEKPVAPPSAETIREDFSKLAYCSLECNEKNCKVFRATKNSELEAKAKIAEQWSKKYGRQFKPEDVACYGCRNKNMPLSYFASQICTVRQCALQKQVVICAYCDDFPACEKEPWTKWPILREKTSEIRSKLRNKSKT